MSDRAARAQALSIEGATLFRAWRLGEAEALFREAAALAPTPDRLHNLATVRQLLGDYAAAEAGFREALALDPGNARARASLGLVILAQGRWAEGFALYDAWREIPGVATRAAPDLGFPLWKGEDLAGRKVLVSSEEGFGDSLMYARFAPLLRAAGAQFAWICSPALTRLFSYGLGVQVIPTGVQAEIERVDYLIPSSRLPVVFMQQLAAPPAAPYLRLPPPNVIEGLSVGIVARGNPEHDNDRNRSLSAEAAAELLALPGAVSLAPEDTGARDFYDTATIVAGLDLVITVDTAVAHLAGALGKPVWILLPAIGCDWRWGASGETTPWYGSARLFRQATAGDWTGVIGQVRAALAAFRAG